MNRARGFTLLELLVVMLIIGLFSGLSVAWLNGGQTPAVQALEQLAAQAQHQAAVARHSGQQLGLRWTGKQPEFVRFEQQRWVAQPWRAESWPTQLSASWPASQVPQVVFTAHGVASAASLQWQWAEGRQRWQWLSNDRLVRIDGP